MGAPDFWDDTEKAQKINQELNDIKISVDKYRALEQKADDLMALWELGMESPEDISEDDVKAELEDLKTSLRSLELEVLLSGEYDANNAYLELHAGAGGTEAQDWTQMLLRMYTRWAERHGFSVETVDLLPGDEAGVKSATLFIRGHNAFGYLKSEKGIHRLVRISPFDSNARRHTSFSGCKVMPEIEDAQEVKINMDEVRVDTYRSSGAGGQHINKTSSAVRLIHIPTGTVVECQNERSQFQNREKALKMLRSKLLDEKVRAQEDEIASNRRSQVGTGDRSERIRTYNYPESRISDHRIGLTLYKLDQVLNGSLDEIIDALATADQAAKLASQEGE